MMKRFISILLVLGMLCTVLPFAALPAFAATDKVKVKVNVLESNSGSCGNEASYEFSKVKKYADANGIAFKDAIVVEKKTCGEAASYELDSEGELRISGSGRIKDGAFQKRNDIKSAIIENGITKIEVRAFSGSSLKSIKLPDSVTSIEDNAFRECGNLESVTIGNGKARIGFKAFSDCSSDLTIISQKGGEVEKYAAANGIRFEEINTAHGIASVLSEGNIGIIIVVAVIAIGGVTALVTVKRKSAPANGGENKDEE